MACLKQGALALATAGLLWSGAAQATLFDRGGGLLYDDVLNITWLQDANYARTSGYSAYGLMNWKAAKTWADRLDYGGYRDWRLARNAPVGADWNYDFSNDGSTDIGYNITSPNSELAFMYYVNLRLKGYLSPSGAVQSDYGVFGNGTWGGEANVGLVKNLQSADYWSGTVYAANQREHAWLLNTRSGNQNRFYQDSEFYAWAVRPGDVAAIPEPKTYALLLGGLGLLGMAAKWRRRSLGAS